MIRGGTICGSRCRRPPVRGACATAARGSVPRRRPAPPVFSVHGTVPVDPSVPVPAAPASRAPRSPRRLRTASGRVRHGGGGAWARRFRRSPRRSRRRRPTHRAARRLAGSRGLLALLLAAPPGLALLACPGGVAVRPRLRRRARYGFGPDALRRPRPSRRPGWLIAHRGRDRLAPPRLRRRGAVGPFSPASAGVPWLVSSDPVRLAGVSSETAVLPRRAARRRAIVRTLVLGPLSALPRLAGRARRARLLRRPFGGLGGRLTRRVGRPLEDRGRPPAGGA